MGSYSFVFEMKRSVEDENEKSSKEFKREERQRTFEDLPVEVVLSIFQYLPPHLLLRTIVTHFRFLIEGQSVREMENDCYRSCKEEMLKSVSRITSISSRYYIRVTILFFILN